MRLSKTKLSANITDLHKALGQAHSIIEAIELEQKRLNDVLNDLTSENNEGYMLSQEAGNEPVCSLVGS